MENAEQVTDRCLLVQGAPLVLLIDDSKFMHGYMLNLVKRLGCRLLCASNGIEGVEMFEQYRPAVVLIDANMPVMDGFTACAVIRKMEGGRNALLVMITTNGDEVSVDTAFRMGVDDYFVKPIVDTVFLGQMRFLLQKKGFGNCIKTSENSMQTELSEARALQASLLPRAIKNECISVNHIYSPFDQVSGDFIDYWWNEQKEILYGYVLDATGHSIASAMQVFALRMLFCQAGKSGLPLHGILGYINFEIFKNDSQRAVRRAIATAILFAVDVKKKTLSYSSAGISPFFLTGNDQTTTIVRTSGYALGAKKTASYDAHTLSLEGMKEIIFASDGFSELLQNNRAVDEKNDDASAIFIKLG